MINNVANDWSVQKSNQQPDKSPISAATLVVCHKVWARVRDVQGFSLNEPKGTHYRTDPNR